MERATDDRTMLIVANEGGALHGHVIQGTMHENLIRNVGGVRVYVLVVMEQQNKTFIFFLYLVG